MTLRLPEQHHTHFKLVTRRWVKMSWGRSLVFVLQRL
jgi:hypothetical protein